MLLNKIPCLDKGYVALISSACNSTRLNEVRDEYFGAHDTPALKKFAYMTVVFKCPLFVQTNLSQFGLTIVPARIPELEAYVPNAGEIGGRDRQLNEDIADDISRTTDALMINPKAYISDGADRFIAQVLTPISCYTTLIIGGSYNDWQQYIQQKSVPAPLVSYINAVKQIMDAEWKS